MKKNNFLPAVQLLHICAFLILLFFTIVGCAKPNIQMPKPLPSIVKEYKSTTVTASLPGMQNTGIHLKSGDVYSLLATGTIDFWPATGGNPKYKPPAGFKYHDVRPELGRPFLVRIGEEYAFNLFHGTNGVSQESYTDGNLYIGYRNGKMTRAGEPVNRDYYRNNRGAFNVDIIVYKEADWIKIYDFLSQLTLKDPDNRALADACYSGASGGRTISLSGIRATIADAFLDRITAGKGTVIMTASGANEVSAEDEQLQHGVFTFYLLEGLAGAADADKDGLITVDEIYHYVSVKVPRATGQEQHPVKKGTVEGRLILSIIR